MATVASIFDRSAYARVRLPLSRRHPRGPHKTRLAVGTSLSRKTVARHDFQDKVRYYDKRWRKSVSEDIDISEVERRGFSSPFARPDRLSHLEPIVYAFANRILDRVLG